MMNKALFCVSSVLATLLGSDTAYHTYFTHRTFATEQLEQGVTKVTPLISS